jgi:hypothetical protein
MPVGSWIGECGKCHKWLRIRLEGERLEQKRRANEEELEIWW